MRRIRLIATDMDGTLLGAAFDKIPPVNARALREASERGITLVLASGRLPDDAGFFAVDAGLPAWVLSLNGCVAQSAALGEVTDARFMSERAARRVRQQMEAMGLPFALFSVHECALSEPPSDLAGAELAVGTFLNRSGGRTRFWPGGGHVEPLMSRVSKFLVVSDGCPEKLPRLRSRIEAATDEVEITSSWVNTLEIIPRGVNKGTALTALAGRLGIPLDEVMAIGDNDNDAAMLAAVGCAVAVANATPAARQAAHWIAPSNGEHGVAAAIRALALGEASFMDSLGPGGRC